MLADTGPAEPMMRLVLLALSTHMHEDGGGAWPSQACLARETAMGERTVRRHLAEAEKLGWVQRQRFRRVSGNSWYCVSYLASVPGDLEEPANPAGTVPANLAHTPDEQPANDSRVPAKSDGVPANQSEQPAKLWPTNSSKNSSSNSSKNSGSAASPTRGDPRSAAPKSAHEIQEDLQREWRTRFPGGLPTPSKADDGT